MSDHFTVIYRDDRLLVLDKPSGLLSVPGRGPDLQDCLASRVQQAFPNALVVHRLDRDTSGLILMALDREAQCEISRQFEQRQVHKAYECVVSGQPDQTTGLIDLPIGRDYDHPPRYKIDSVHGRASQTRWHLIETNTTGSRLEIRPITGRSHQIRLHLATLGHPILGDPLYANQAAFAAADRLLLHARDLQLAHPDTGQTISWQSACPF